MWICIQTWFHLHYTCSSKSWVIFQMICFTIVYLSFIPSHRVSAHLLHLWKGVGGICCDPANRWTSLSWYVYIYIYKRHINRLYRTFCPQIVIAHSLPTISTGTPSKSTISTAPLGFAPWHYNPMFGGNKPRSGDSIHFDCCSKWAMDDNKWGLWRTYSGFATYSFGINSTRSCKSIPCLWYFLIPRL